MYAAQRLCSSILWSLREIALSGGEYREAVRLLKNDLSSNYGFYRRCSLSRPERMRLILLRTLPFDAYRKIEQMRFAQLSRRAQL